MYPYKQIIDRARNGRTAVYPKASDSSRLSIMGAKITGEFKRFPTMEDILIVPPLFTPQRLEKSIDLLVREPVFFDVELAGKLGGFHVSMPLVQSSMGSPDVWNLLAPYAAKACALEGIIYGIGENVAATWGYETRKVKSQPCLKERILAYFENFHGKGGVVIQQNEEDAQSELWNRLYSDPDLTQFFEDGFIAFEIKGGQGAKAGMGGERYIDRKTALELKDTYYIHPDPEMVEQERYERHSAPDIFTEEILRNRIIKMKNDYPNAKIWLKVGPYRDLARVLEIAGDTGVDCLSIDGKEGGTGMSPSVAMSHVGLPILACIALISEQKKKYPRTDVIISGRMMSGADLVKAMALGMNGIAMGRPFLISGYSFRFAERYLASELYRKKLIAKIAMKIRKPNEQSVQLIRNFVETIRIEAQLLTAGLGKYDLKKLSKEDLATVSEQIATMLDIPSIYSQKEMFVKPLIVA